MSHRLIFDLGTTNFKAVLFDPSGGEVAVQRVATPMDRPTPGRFEIQPEAFKQSIVSLCEALRGGSPAAYSDIRQVSFATQANSFLLLDRDNQPLTPIVVWLDERAKDMPLPPINDYAVTGLPSVGCQNSVAKFAWFAKHEPELWSRTKRFCYISDYLTLWWTGQYATAACVAGLSGMFDIHRLAWRSGVVEALGMGHIELPEPRRAGAIASPVRREVCGQVGLAGCEFYVGCLDQYAASYAAGLAEDQGVCETTGTVLATVRPAGAFDAALCQSGVYQGPGRDAGQYFQMVFGSVSANLLEQFRTDHAPHLTAEQLDAAAAAVYTNSIGETHADAELGHSVLKLYRRVAVALLGQLDVLYPQRPIPRLVSLGGGARSETWRSVKAQVIGQAPEVLPSGEPTAYGVFNLLG